MGTLMVFYLAVMMVVTLDLLDLMLVEMLGSLVMMLVELLVLKKA